LKIEPKEFAVYVSAIRHQLQAGHRYTADEANRVIVNRICMIMQEYRREGQLSNAIGMASYIANGGS
jgi:hypothetical protein